MIFFLLKLHACISMFALTMLLPFNEFQSKTSPETSKNIFKNSDRF